jgi:phospholipid/cholesterol/gamma-HCH transport system permease protein
MFALLGQSIVRFLGYTGEVTLLAWETLYFIVRGRIRWGLMARQIAELGFRSQLVVMVTGAFSGAVFTAQTFFQFHQLGMDSKVGSVVAVSMFRELGPVLTGLMLAGRVGASIAAEIGTMKVTEQIDALRALGVQPVDYLVVPRVIALILSTPLLVAECVGLSLLSSYIVGVKILGISEAYFITYMQQYAGLRDIKMTLTKGFVFGILIVFIACHQGLKAQGGAEGVGRAPTEAIVISSLAILVTNFILSFALQMLFPYGQ